MKSQINLKFISAFIILHFMLYLGCNIKDDHPYANKKIEDSLKTVNFQREIYELWLNIDKQKNLLASSIKSGNRNHLEVPIEEIISLSKTLLLKHKEIQQDKKDNVLNIIAKLKKSGEDIEKYNKLKHEQLLLRELTYFNHLIEEMREIYIDNK
jgi:hypothetical protein